MNEFYYGTGRVRALESRLLTPSQIERMASADDFESAFSVLGETPYAENLSRVKTAFNFEELLEMEFTSLKDLMDRLAPGNTVLRAFFNRHDYLNLKVLLRAYYAGKKGPQPSSKAGNIPVEKLRLYVYEGVKDIEDVDLIQAADEAKSSFEQEHDPRLVDIILDRHYFSQLKAMAGNSPSPLIQELVDHQIDAANLMVLLRARQTKKDPKFLEAALLEPGLIDKDILLELIDKSVPDIINRLAFTTYLPYITAGLEEHGRNGSFHLLEKLLDDLILERFRKARYLSSGVEPLVGFYLAKEAEIGTVRFILVCKKNAVGAHSVKDRLRMSYA